MSNSLAETFKLPTKDDVVVVPKNYKIYRRYNNRKIYDQQESRYTKASELLEKFKSGILLKIFDEAGEDITLNVLLVALAEEVKYTPDSSNLDYLIKLVDYLKGGNHE